MKRVFWAGMALLAVLGIPLPSATAQFTRTYSPATSVIVPGATATSYVAIAVNRNAGSPYNGYLYVCEAAAYKKVRVLKYNTSTQAWDLFGSIAPSTTTGKPYDVAIAPDDSVWFIDSVNKKIESAPHPTVAAPNPTATTRVTLTSTAAPISLTVTGNAADAKVYVAYNNTKMDGFSVSGAAASTLFSNISVGYNVYGLAVDGTGSVCAPSGASSAGLALIKRFDPLTGASASPATLALRASWMGSPTLFDLDFVSNAGYPGGGYFVFATRLGSAAPYKLAVYRFAVDGTYLDGFGAAQAGSVNYSTVDIAYPSQWSGAYVAPDQDGNFFARFADGSNGGVLRIDSVPPPGPWGDVNADNFVTDADADLIDAYIANPSTLSPAQQDRIQRYGDVAGVVNRNIIGNDVVDSQDSSRLLLLSGGGSDAGTAGTAPAHYGDVNNDGKTNLLDAVLVQRALQGNNPDAAILTAIHTRGIGDISPTIPQITFGDKAITAADSAVIRARFRGSEANPPAYTDFWPMLAPNIDDPAQKADTYTFTDTTGRSGDLMHQIAFQTQQPKEYKGYTITEVIGTDNSLAGVFKGLDGSIYAMYLKYPYAFGDRLLVFDSPIKLLDIQATKGSATWSGKSSTSPSDLGYRPVVYTGTMLSQSDVYTPASGAFTASSDTPKSTWSQSIRLRLDVAILAGPKSSTEMQQAFFFDLMPFIGVVQRGQAATMGSAAPMLDRPFLRLDETRVRGITFNEMTP